MERKFKEYVGIAPKKFADIVRLQNFLKALKRQSDDCPLTEIVYNFGYYDQAHLNNYFKRNTGVTPLHYKTNPNLLAINLMQVI
jgi:AraC-like DNA-binding protein